MTIGSTAAHRGAMTCIAIAALAGCPPSATAQVRVRSVHPDWVGTLGDDYARVLQLTGVMPLSSRMIRPSESPRHWSPPDSARWRAPWSSWYREDSLRADETTRVDVYDAWSQVTYNSAFPGGMNDGVQWAGRGLSLAQTVGARFERGPLTLDLAPTFTWSENKSFGLGPQYRSAPDASPYADQFNTGIDRPQRFGDRPLYVLDPGQGTLALHGRGVRAGASTRNLWWGPGIDDAIIMTNNAAGIPHAFAGTDRPRSVGVGTVEALWIVGTLSQSRYWRLAGDTTPRDRWLNGATVVFEPRGAPGVYFGASRVFYMYQRYNPITPREIFSMFQTFNKRAMADSANPEGNDARDQLFSFTFRWVFPEAGFEAYGEWGRNDHNSKWRDAVVQPDHAQGTLIGARKVLPLCDGLLSLRFESTSLENSLTSFAQGTGVWYQHSKIRQGYTQDGQIIGSEVGPSGTRQTAAVEWLRPGGLFGFLIRRQRREVQRVADLELPLRPWDTSVSGGPRVVFESGRMQWEATYLIEREYDRYSIAGNDAWNHRLELRGEIRAP